MTSHASDEDILDLYRQLRNVHEVRKKLRTGMGRVSEVLNRHRAIPDTLTQFKKIRKEADDSFEAEIVAEYRSGTSTAEVASSRLSSIGTILVILRKHGVPIRSTKPHLTLEEKEEAKRLYESGLTFKEVGRITGRHSNTILRLMNDEYPEIVRSKLVGPKGPHWKGGKNFSHGYAIVWVAKDDPLYSMAGRTGYALEHRLILARRLGRPLLSTETVHHIDGDHTNNDPDNLQLRHGKHGKNIVLCCADCGSRNVKPVALD